MLAIIGGSNLLHSSYFANLEKKVINTPFGEVLLHFGKDFVFCQRHHANPHKDYAQPHLINKRAIISALVSLKVSKIIAFGSVGSLHTSLKLGTVICPDDFFNLWEQISFYDDKRAHIVPTLESDLRKEVIQVLEKSGIDVVKKGVYAQTTGPRFETKAEIRFLSNYADVVGMTAAHEATLCLEVKIPYALICMIDNMGHGVSTEELSMEQFEAGLRENAKKVENILSIVLQNFTSK